MADFSNEERRRFEERAWTLAVSGGAEPLEALTDLAGSDDSTREAVGAREGTSGSLEGYVVIQLLPREQAQRLLPRGLELAPQPICAPDRHPVFLLFAREQLQSRAWGRDYAGVTLGVPFVQHADPHVPHRGPFIYRPQQYVDDLIPCMMGRRVYGFERDRAKIEVDDNAYRIYDRDDGEMVIEAWFEKKGDPVAPTTVPGFDAVRQIFDQPTISQAFRIIDEHALHERGGPFLGCIHRLLFDDSGAQLTHVNAVVQIKGEVSPPAFPRERIVSPSLAAQELGAFHIRVPQEISLPTQSVKLRFPKAPLLYKKRVAVLGGGPAACAAAFYLAKTQRYDVTLYTLGYRLGGKCAAGRNPELGHRIEEHGLHAFLGFYNNAFRTLREVYEAADIPINLGQGPWSAQRLADGEGPYARAFEGTNTVGLMGRWTDAEGEKHWRYYATSSEVNDGVPGEVPFEPRGPRGLARAVKVTVDEARRQARELRRRNRGAADESSDELKVERQSWLERNFGRMAVPFAPSDDPEDDDQIFDVIDTLDRIKNWVEQVVFEEITDDMAAGTRFMNFVADQLAGVRRRAGKDYEERIFQDPDAWFEWSGLDITVTIAIGLIRERVSHLEELDGYDLVEWLQKHGVTEGNERSPMVLFLYDSSFATSKTKPVVADHLAAGVGIRWLLLLLDYQGFQAYEFRYSCPQTLMSPYYHALKNLGVKVNFFHKVEALHVERDGDERRLKSVRIQRQATVKGGPSNYDPHWLPELPNNPRGFEPWGNRPDYRQLEEGEALAQYDLEDAWTPWQGAETIELQVGRDIDLCVCGMSLGALPAVTQDLIEPSSPAYCAAWADMIDGMALCQTVSFQLWMECPQEQVYGPDGVRGIPDRLGLFTQFAEPEGSFGNFTHLIQREDWANADGVSTPPAFLAYHTGAWESGHPLEGHPFTDHEYTARTQAQWKAEAMEWLEANYQDLYNRAPKPFFAFCEQLVGPDGSSGEQRLKLQYFNVGMQPWDLYVLSHPGTGKLRLGQSESWCKGLFLCGDWTTTDINAGCVEAATQSGMLASRAISQHPRYVWYTGY
ncbi:MAG: NAD(P)-binding protein [Myxococcota bacterium]